MKLCPAAVSGTLMPPKIQLVTGHSTMSDSTAEAMKP